VRGERDRRPGRDERSAPGERPTREQRPPAGERAAAQARPEPPRKGLPIDPIFTTPYEPQTTPPAHRAERPKRTEPVAALLGGLAAKRG
jgi:hypothetical protein